MLAVIKAEKSLPSKNLVNENSIYRSDFLLLVLNITFGTDEAMICETR